MRISRVESSDLFVGSVQRPLQIVAVTVEGPSDGEIRLRVEGPSVSTPSPATVERLNAGESRRVEVGVALAAPVTEGAPRPVTAIALSGDARIAVDATITAAVPGWTMWMISHFHYDPVWWNTQAAYTQSWYDVPAADEARPKTTVFTAFDLVRAHLEAARRDDDYKFVLAELDYLKPHWDACPEDRADLRRLMAEGRIEIVGGNYNEPSTNLTHPESTIRNAVYGIGYQRDVIGGDPRSAWMLDVFGHDPSYPGLMADAGLDSSAWARGPYHMWGPNKHVGDNGRMQFPAEFEWISPDGKGLLTHYMPNHYSAGWAIDHQATTLDDALRVAHEQFAEMKPMAATRNVFLPVGGDHVVPSRWCTGVHREWAARYVWPRFTMGLPREFFAAVRAELGERRPRPQTRDMNPVYTGKDVTAIDLKQAQQAAEIAVLDGERLATLASLLGGRYPSEALDKAWRQLAFNAHHDAVTGVGSDQVYLDVLGGFREAYELGDQVRTAALDHLAAQADTSGEGTAVVVANTLSWARSGLAAVRVPGGGRVVDETGAEVPSLAEGGTVTFLASEVPSLGFRVYRVLPSDGSSWTPREGATAANDAYAVEASAEGALVSIVDRRTGRQLLRQGALGGQFVLQEEHATHPVWGEGPWHLLPKSGMTAASGATVRAESSPLGERLLLTTRLAGLRITQEVLLWRGVDRIDFRAHVDGSIGENHLLRVRFGLDAPGAKPVAEVGYAAVGRSFGFPSSDTAEHLWTLDSPARTWAGLSATLRIVAGGLEQAVGVAEVVADESMDDRARALLAAMAAQGVTATLTRPEGQRYGSLDLDSNLPDVRVVLGDNAVARAVLDAADPAYAAELARSGAVLIPPAATVAGTWVPGADVRGPRDLPTLIATEALHVRGGVIEVDQRVPGVLEPYHGASVALLNRGLPSFVAETDGTLHLSLLRACTAWPSGVWLNEPHRKAPDGSAFTLQHWSHTFHFSLVSGAGDWREAGFVRAGQEYTHELLTRVAPAHPGTLPARLSLASVEPASAVLTALKPRGNPMASGGSGEIDSAAGLTIRAYESEGRATRARVRVFTGLGSGEVSDVLEARSVTPLEIVDGAAEVTLAPAQIATLALSPLPTGSAATAGSSLSPLPSPALGPVTEPAQPVFSRYWLHDKGPAPMGYLPVAVHLSPSQVRLAGPGDSADVTLTVACSTRPASGKVELLLPPGLTVDAPSLDYQLAPGDHASYTLRVSGADGVRHLAARIDDDLGQTVEDTVAVIVGDASADLPVKADVEPGEVRLRPGESGELVLRLECLIQGEVRGEAQLLSPYGTWDLASPWTQGFAVGPDAPVILRYPVGAPESARPGSHWWALVKVACFGHLHYTRAIPIEIV
ncbi:glycoside hydrolase family 38 C-terminal domain-containing protein [Nonomuraea dietziae]|uniref:glycoside hydrolase family 38 N-terminal domain-containing protein n=1 Tax=Nonomuraea dietziae TaxID=65515 RepID=UPI0034407DBD